jgi:succinate dehydrogenase / fumarate reductase cytochrome b subunit
MNSLARPARPKHLNLLVIRLPLPGFVSILHRASGVLLALSIPLCIHFLQLSLEGPAGFGRVKSMLAGVPGQLLVFVLAWSLAHHLLAGIRYLLLDFDVGVSKPQARASAWVVLGGGVLLALAISGLLA